ncbi:MAG TPA: AraC family transcriptional regulator [Puia sp.]
MDDYPLDTNSTDERNIISLANYGVNNALVIGKYHYKSAREGLDSHLHKDIIEICYCHKGQQVYEVNGKTYCIRGGDVFVAFPNEIHSTGMQPEEKGILYWLLIEACPGKSFFQFDKEESAVFLHTLTSLPRRHFRGSVEMRRTLESIFGTTKRQRGKMQKIILENLIVSFLIQVIDVAGGASDHMSQVPENRVKIEQFIDGNYKESLSIEVMACMLNLSESRFKSWFKDQFGVPPLEFILRKRIQEAKRIMQSEKYVNMSTIAYDLGFSSPQHFATMFRRYTSLSPKEFKASVASVVEV